MLLLCLQLCSSVFGRKRTSMINQWHFGQIKGDFVNTFREDGFAQIYYPRKKHLNSQGGGGHSLTASNSQAARTRLLPAFITLPFFFEPIKEYVLTNAKWNSSHGYLSL